MSTDGKFRTTRWINTKTMETWWGLLFVPKGKRQGMPVKNDKGPMFYNTEKEAKAMARELNAGDKGARP